MNHLEGKEIKAYIRGTLTEEKQEAFEDHLYSCNKCLENYMEQLTFDQGVLPIIQDPQSFTDKIIAKVPVKSQRKRERSAAVLHYVIAAAATIFLMFSGVFHGIFTYSSNVELSDRLEEKELAASLIDKIFHYIDHISLKEER